MGFQDVGWWWGGGAMEWIDLTWDRDKWQALVNVIMNFFSLLFLCACSLNSLFHQHMHCILKHYTSSLK